MSYAVLRSLKCQWSTWPAPYSSGAKCAITDKKRSQNSRSLRKCCPAKCCFISKTYKAVDWKCRTWKCWAVTDLRDMKMQNMKSKMTDHLYTVHRPFLRLDKWSIVCPVERSKVGCIFLKLSRERTLCSPLGAVCLVCMLLLLLLRCHGHMLLPDIHVLWLQKQPAICIPSQMLTWRSLWLFYYCCDTGVLCWANIHVHFFYRI